MCDMSPKAASSAVGDAAPKSASYDARTHTIALAVRRANRRRTRPGVLQVAAGIALVVLAIIVAFSPAADSLPIITAAISTVAVVAGFVLAVVGLHRIFW